MRHFKDNLLVQFSSVSLVVIAACVTLSLMLTQRMGVHISLVNALMIT